MDLRARFMLSEYVYWKITGKGFDFDFKKKKYARMRDLQGNVYASWIEVDALTGD